MLLMRKISIVIIKTLYIFILSKTEAAHRTKSLEFYITWQSQGQIKFELFLTVQSYREKITCCLLTIAFNMIVKWF
jgi:hypothetical protein